MTESRPHSDSEGFPPVGVPAPPSMPVSAGSASRGTVGARRVEKPSESGQPADKDVPLTTLVLEKSPPWLVSMVVHMVALIVMGLIILSQTPPNPIHLSAEAVPDTVADQVDTDSPPGLPEGSPEGTGDVLTPSDLPPVDDPLASPGKVAVRPGGTLATSDVNVGVPGVAWTNRGTQLRLGVQAHAKASKAPSAGFRLDTKSPCTS